MKFAKTPSMSKPILILFQVESGTHQKFRTILEPSEPLVAATTQPPSNVFRLVIVVGVESCLPTTYLTSLYAVQHLDLCFREPIGFHLLAESVT